MKNLSKNQKHYVVLYTGYLFILFVAFRNVFISNYANAFLRLFGFKSRWFVYDPTNSLPPIPGEPGSPGVPSYPEPDWGDIPIVTPNYWKFVLTNIFRSIVIFLIAFIAIQIVLWIIRQYEYRSKKQETVFYKLYTKSIKSVVDKVSISVRTYLFELLNLFLNKINIITMLLLFFVVSGWLPLILSGTIQSLWDLFVYSPGVWLLLHTKAILFGLYRFISSFTVINILVVFVIVYITVSFVYAYISQTKNDKELEEKVDSMPYGVNEAGRSGSRKTMTLTNLGSASHRNARRHIEEYLQDNESAYGRMVNFNKVRKYYADHKSNLRNSIDCEDLSIKFVNEFNIPDIEHDRFRGKTPSLHEKLKWHFVGMWLIDKRILLASSVNMYINDPKLSDEVRDNLWDILTRRHKDVSALRFNFNAIKKTLKDLMGKVDENGNLIITPEETRDIRKKFAEANFSIEPCMTIVLPELDKDFHNSDRAEIIKDGTDKILAILRHFVAFDERTFSHIFFDAQQPDGVANVVRGRFDYTLYLSGSTQKRSLFLAPYIMYLEKRIKAWEKVRLVANTYSPYKKSFFRIFLAWRAERLKRYHDFLSSFNYYQVKAKTIDAFGQGDISFKLNVATSDYQYKSTQFQELYQQAKRTYSTFRYEHLEQWNGNRFTVDDAVKLHSKFVDSIFGIEREGDKEDEDDSSKERDYIADLLHDECPGATVVESTPKKRKGGKKNERTA